MFKYKNIYLIAITMLMSLNGIAQSSTTNTKGAKSSNYLELLMIVIAGLLAVVIFVLSNVLIMIAKKMVEISKLGKKVMMVGWIVMGSLFANAASAENLATDSTTKALSINYYGGLSSITFWTLSSVLALELLIVFLLVLFIKGILNVLHPLPVGIKNGKSETSSWLLRSWNTLDRKFLTRAIPMEKEADMLLDHDYDGIKELDNALPPWWKYGFYITIFIAFIYLLKYEIWHTGPNPTEEYSTEMNTAKDQIDAYLASMKNNVDEKTVTMSDAVGISAGAVSYAKTCVPCHGAKGEGGVGPNLTDDYWLHGGAMSDIFKTIKYGYPDKGMQSWQSTLSPIQMQELVSYIKTMRGTNPPNAKAPQGDLYKESANAIDSTAPKKESLVGSK